MRPKHWILLAAAAVLFASVSMAAAQAGSAPAAVPNVVGMKIAEAQKMLQQQGWRFNTQYREVADPQQIDVILTTGPPAGARVSKQQMVTLIAGKSARQARVPNVTGMPLAAAQRSLASVKLNAVVTMQTVHDQTKNYVVLDQKAAPGATLAPGTQVPLVVGRYQPPAAAAAHPTMPNVTGMRGRDAEETLKNAKLHYSIGLQPVTDQEKNGIVLGQNPAPGSKIAPGATVAIAVGVQGLTPSTAAALKSQPPAKKHLGTVKNPQQANPVALKQDNIPPENLPASVPNVTGMPLNEAQRAMASARLNATVSLERIADRTKDNIVLKQQTAPGTRLAPGSRVHLIVGRHAAP
jgi:beta-lactam-binding protein with PASTA domain